MTNIWIETPPCAPPGWTPMPSPPGELGVASSFFMEALAVTAPNALSSLSHAPLGDFVMLVVNGTTFLPVGSPASFSVTGTNVNWLSPIYALNPSDSVAIVYTYLDVVP